jgi:hypothetical protein
MLASGGGARVVFGIVVEGRHLGSAVVKSHYVLALFEEQRCHGSCFQEVSSPYFTRRLNIYG